MATIRPFRGLRFTAEAGPLPSLTAPPYDVISASEREEFAARNPHNIVQLTLPESRSDDRSKFIKYARSAATLTAWRREGVLSLEQQPAFYRYTQRFTLPRVAGVLERTSMIALIKVEPYSKQVVLPHEQTFPKHKEDRLRILEATRAHLECIFGLYEDPDGSILAFLKNSPASEAISTRSDDGVDQLLEPITDPESCHLLSQLLADKKVWIADGHHRYETALTFREMRGEQAGPVPEDYMMMALSSMSDPGLVLMPTHRILKTLPMSGEEFLEKAGAYFSIRAIAPEEMLDEIEVLKSKGTASIGVLLAGGEGHLLTVSDVDRVSQLTDGDGSDALRRLDVSLLHEGLFKKLLGITSLDGISYSRDEAEAIQASRAGAAAVFMMSPPSVEDMRTIALGGEKMPQKSTYYFPKILSGLVLWSLNDFSTGGASA